MKPGHLRVAAVQAAPTLLDQAATLDRLDTWTKRAADQGVRLAAFPEVFVPGYPAWLDDSPNSALWNHPGAKAVFQRLVENSVEVPGPVVTRIGALAKSLAMTLIVGVHERAGRTLYSTLLTFAPDGQLANHRRKLMPT